jgi:hypothetical protein
MSNRKTTKGKRRTQRETRQGGKVENYLKGIMPIFGRSLGREVCLAMASEWKKETDKLKDEYHAFKKMYPDLTSVERRDAWRCFAHAHRYYRRECNVKCVSLNLNIDLHSAVSTLYRLEEYNTACRWGLEPVFEELWRRGSAYEVVSEIRERLGVFVREMGIEDLDKLCLNLVHVGYEATRKCKLCGNPYEPLNFGVIRLEGCVEGRSERAFCPSISICTECYRKLLDKGILKNVEMGTSFYVKST